MVLTTDALDVLCHDDRFLFVRISRFQLQALSMFIFREDILRDLSFVSTDQGVGCLYDQLRRTVVLFQFEESGILILRLEIKDIIDISPTEGVDALGIITHDTHLLTLFRELIDNSLLGIVRVLILIDQYELELLDILLTDILMVMEQQPGLYQQVVEVHRISLATPLRVPYIYIAHLRALLLGIVACPGTLGILLRQQQMVLGHRDTISHRRRFIHFVIETQFLDDRFD